VDFPEDITIDDGRSGSAETTLRDPVRFVPRQTRVSLISYILTYPQQLPSTDELEKLTHSASDATAYKHIQRPTDAGLVKEAAPNDDQHRQESWKFYGLTDEARELSEEHNTIAAKEAL